MTAAIAVIPSASTAATTVALMPSTTVELVVATTVELVAATAVKLMASAVELTPSAAAECLLVSAEAVVTFEPMSLATEVPISMEPAIFSVEAMVVKVTGSSIAVEVAESSIFIEAMKVVTIEVMEIVTIEPTKPFAAWERDKSRAVPPTIERWVQVVEVVPRAYTDEHAAGKPLRSPVTIRSAVEGIVVVISVWTRRRSVVKPICRADLHTDRHLCVRMDCRQHHKNRQQGQVFEVTHKSNLPANRGHGSNWQTSQGHPPPQAEDELCHS